MSRPQSTRGPFRTVRVPEALYGRLKAASDERVVSVSLLVEWALDRFLDKLVPLDEILAARAEPIDLPVEPEPTPVVEAREWPTFPIRPEGMDGFRCDECSNIIVWDIDKHEWTHLGPGVDTAVTCEHRPSGPGFWQSATPLAPTRLTDPELDYELDWLAWHLIPVKEDHWDPKLRDRLAYLRAEKTSRLMALGTDPATD